jgi:hypothetical protein
MNARKLSRVFVAGSALVLAIVMMASGSVSCGGRWVHKSSIFVGTTDSQQAFYSALIAVNAYHYPFADVDASTGRIVTGQVDLGGGNWFSFNIQVAPTGEVQIDPVTNMEKPHQGGIIIPRGVLNRANNIGRYIRKVVVSKSPQQIALEGEQIHQSVLSGLAIVGADAVATPVVDDSASEGAAAPVPPSGG